MKPSPDPLQQKAQLKTDSKGNVAIRVDHGICTITKSVGEETYIIVVSQEGLGSGQNQFVAILAAMVEDEQLNFSMEDAEAVAADFHGFLELGGNNG